MATTISCRATWRSDKPSRTVFASDALLALKAPSKKNQKSEPSDERIELLLDGYSLSMLTTGVTPHYLKRVCRLSTVKEVNYGDLLIKAYCMAQQGSKVFIAGFKTENTAIMVDLESGEYETLFFFDHNPVITDAQFLPGGDVFFVTSKYYHWSSGQGKTPFAWIYSPKSKTLESILDLDKADIKFNSFQLMYNSSILVKYPYVFFYNALLGSVYNLETKASSTTTTQSFKQVVVHKNRVFAYFSDSTNSPDAMILGEIDQSSLRKDPPELITNILAKFDTAIEEKQSQYPSMARDLTHFWLLNNYSHQDIRGIYNGVITLVDASSYKVSSQLALPQHLLISKLLVTKVWTNAAVMACLHIWDHISLVANIYGSLHFIGAHKVVQGIALALYDQRNSHLLVPDISKLTIRKLFDFN